MQRLIIFDLDGTLAESKQPIDREMGDLLARLLAIVRVAVISGGDWPQFERQLLRRLPKGAARAKLYLLPASGTKLYCFDGAWREIYAEKFTAGEREHILQALEKAIAMSGLAEGRAWGERIEDRGSQITFSGLGQRAPVAAKANWDPDLRKRTRLQALIEPMLPGFNVRIGGATSIDITRQGVDKAYGVARLAGVAGVDFEDMLFVGDALFPGGNDAPVRGAGIASIAVSGVDETRTVIASLIAAAVDRA